MSPEDLHALVEEGLRLSKEVPPAGATFATSVSKKLQAIDSTVQKTESVTPKQADAVNNMVGALQKWTDAPIKH